MFENFHKYILEKNSTYCNKVFIAKNRFLCNDDIIFVLKIV